MSNPSLPAFAATRYLTPLREGGSLPAIVETEGSGLYVVKFRGAGQGAKALIAEVIVGSIASSLGLPVPEMALIDLAEDFGRTEPDPEIQDILAGSRGLNFGLRFLDGAMNFDPVAAGDLVNEDLATTLVWLDGLVTNPDRGHKNTNLLAWGGRLWLIDHGAALFAHHNWSRVTEAKTRTAFPAIEGHVLLDQATDLVAADARLAPQVDHEVVRQAVERVPDAWLVDDVGGTEFATPSEARERYMEYLNLRLAGPRDFAAEAESARLRLKEAPPGPLSARR